MSVIVLQSDESTSKLLINLAKKLGVKVAKYDDKQAEELALLSMMKKERTGKNVSRETIMKKLKK